MAGKTILTIVPLLAAMIGSAQGGSPVPMPDLKTEISSSEIKLTWIDEQTLEMRQADNSTDKIFLLPANNIPGLVSPCLFSGILQGDADAVVSVSGCKDTETTVSIASWKVPDGLINLVLSGDKTSRITFHSPTDPVELLRIRRQSEGAMDESKTKLTWTKSNEIEAVFENGLKDKIHLIADKGAPCLFTGSLDNDQDSEVTIVGCQGDAEVLVEIASYREAGGVLELILSSDGKTYDVPQKNWDVGNDALPEPDDEDTDDADLPQAIFSGSLPASVTLKVRLKYDNTLLRHYDNDHTKVKHWLSRIVGLTKPKLSALDVKVHLETPVLSIEHHDADMEADHKWIYGLIGDGSHPNLKEDANIGLSGPISYFTASGSDSILGIAWPGSACSLGGKQININEKTRIAENLDHIGDLFTANTFAHELGHNMGMEHDYHQKHGGRDSSCNKQEGLMGPGSGSANTRAWSTCSNNDFAEWYKSKGSRCLKSGAGRDPDLPNNEGCEKEQGSLYGLEPTNPDVPGHPAFRSAGPDDCAAKCSRVAGCKAWTLHKRSNLCWLKTTDASKDNVPSWYRGKPCASAKASALKGCECNGHKSSITGHGECNIDDSKCGRWCFVDDDAQCLEASPSFNGETYRWTCEACQNNSTVTQSDKNNSAMIQSGIGLLLIGLLVALL